MFSIFSIRSRYAAVQSAVSECYALRALKGTNGTEVGGNARPQRGSKAPTWWAQWHLHEKLRFHK